MTDKEFKRLGRAQLLDIIYQLQLQVDDLTQKNKQLENALEDKRLRIDNAGSLAAAALELNGCFSNAQSAAEQYLNEIKTLRETTKAERQRLHNQAKAEVSEAHLKAAEIVANAQEEATGLVSAAQAEASQIISDAQEEAAVILRAAKRYQQDYDAAIEMILREYHQSEMDS